MKIYVIERGEYSSKYVYGVVASKEEAERVCQNINSGSFAYHNDARYEEFDTDQFVTKGLKWVVEYEYYEEWTARCEDTYDFYEDQTENCELYDGCYIVFADNKDQAIKIAQDIRAEKIAEREGVKV